MYDRAAPNATSADGPGEFHPEDHETRPELEAASYFIRLLATCSLPTAAIKTR